MSASAAAFAYTAGWLSPERLTPKKLVAALAPPGGPVLGHRRNHARGICFTGTFDANGEGSTLSTASVFVRGQYPLLGRFNTAGPDPAGPDPMAAVRGFGTRIVTPDGSEWRGAAIDAPFFAAPTPEAFYEFLEASGSKDPNAFKGYAAAHPEVLTFVGWAKGHPRYESWAEDRFNGLDSFIATDASGTRRAVRWSFVPGATGIALTPDELAKRPPDFLDKEISERVAKGPLTWKLAITVANPEDPTADPTKAWPADRRTVDVGTLVVTKVVPEVDGPCRDVNFDPAVLPAGLSLSDDPFPAARSAAYRESFNARTGEESHYPHTAPAAGGAR